MARGGSFPVGPSRDNSYRCQSAATCDPRARCRHSAGALALSRCDRPPARARRWILGGASRHRKIHMYDGPHTLYHTRRGRFEPRVSAGGRRVERRRSGSCSTHFTDRRLLVVLAEGVREHDGLRHDHHLVEEHQAEDLPADATGSPTRATTRRAPVLAAASSAARRRRREASENCADCAELRCADLEAAPSYAKLRESRARLHVALVRRLLDVALQARLDRVRRVREDRDERRIIAAEKRARSGVAPIES